MTKPLSRENFWEELMRLSGVHIGTMLFLVAGVCTLLPAQSPQANVLRLTRRITLPAVQGGFNHMSVDAKDQRLFVPEPSDKAFEVIDLRLGKPWRRLKSERPTAVLYFPEFGEIYLTSGHILHVYRANTLQAIARADLHTRLDQLRYDARAKELYVGCMSEGSTGIAVIAIPTLRLLGRVRLPSSPQGVAVEQTGMRIFANLPARGSIAVIDRRERKIVTIWTLGRASENFPMALDEKDHRLFVACRNPAELLVLDTHTGRVIAQVPCVGDADDMSYDAARKRIYITGDEGFVSVIGQRDADRYRSLARIQTAPGGANSAFSQELKSLYVGVPPRGSEPAEILVYHTGE